ncbi:hypothetical protein Tco_0793813, partial [Tanacetum coccineum]
MEILFGRSIGALCSPKPAPIPIGDPTGATLRAHCSTKYSYSPKNVNNDTVSPSSQVLREEDVRGVESDLVNSFEEGEIRDDSV